MPVMEITTVIGCRNACKYCGQAMLTRAYRRKGGVSKMTIKTFKTCIGKIPREVDIHFSGLCEPWLNTKCTDMVLLSARTGHGVAVNTTLTDIRSRDIEVIRRIPYIFFNVHLPCGERQERISVNRRYLRVLAALMDSGIPVEYTIKGKTIHPRLKGIINRHVLRTAIYAIQSGNMRIGGKNPPERRRRGVIGCRRDLRQNVLLPNGDVILCCSDCGMKHILGNLLRDDYESLFTGEEFSKIKSGLRDDTIDILCRYCDSYAFNAGPGATSARTIPGTR